MLYPEYVWFTFGSLSDGWWRDISRTGSCPESSILQVINGSLGIVPAGYFAVDTSSTFFGLVSTININDIVV